MSVNLKPLGDRVIVRPPGGRGPDLRRGQLILPDTAREKPQQGKVLAVGPGRRDEEGKRIPMEVKVGDVVVYAKYSGTTFKTRDGKELLILKESDILAIVE